MSEQDQEQQQEQPQEGPKPHVCRVPSRSDDMRDSMKD